MLSIIKATVMVDTALVTGIIMVTDRITITVAVVPATDHPTMAAAPTTTAALLVMEGMLVPSTAPTMAGTVHHLTAVGTAAHPTEVVVTEEATTESRSINK